MRWLRSFAKHLPSTCVVCGRTVPTTANLCGACFQDLPWIEHACSICGDASMLLLEPIDHCAQCVLSPPPFQRCIGLFHYQSPVDRLITGFKFNAHFEMGHTLAALLSEHLQRHYQFLQPPELLIPVPLHRQRLQTRGYNQAAVLAKHVSRQCGIPLSLSAIVRVRNTAPQTELGSARSRSKNVRAAFRVGDLKLLRSVTSIALIDDVVTTMATVREISNELQATGIERVDVWCIARASR